MLFLAAAVKHEEGRAHGLEEYLQHFFSCQLCQTLLSSVEILPELKDLSQKEDLWYQRCSLTKDTWNYKCKRSIIMLIYMYIKISKDLKTCLLDVTQANKLKNLSFRRKKYYKFMFLCSVKEPWLNLLDISKFLGHPVSLLMRFSIEFSIAKYSLFWRFES